MTLEERYADIQRRMKEACDRAGRDPDSVRLIAVSKTHPVDSILSLHELGQRAFGESKVQEAQLKIPDLPPDIEWRMIGHLQTNKCRDAARLFSAIESVDSPKVAVELQQQLEKRAKSMPVLLEINIAGEATKYGFRPEEALARIDELNGLDRLEIMGLMTIAPYTQDPERVRPHFQALRELRDQLQDKLGAPLTELSMGMSGDFEIAIEEGATSVRVGSLLFGPRNYSKKKSQ